jgi:4-hydroxymandelate oxidase
MDITTLLTLSDVERAARAALDQAVWAYVAGGAGSERTVSANVAAFDAVWLRPRILGTSSPTPDTRVRLFDRELSMPILLAPTSPQRLFHEDAELATARAAVAAGTVSIVSTDSHYPLRTVAETSARTCWFQLYPYGSRADVEATIDMAVDSGAAALVLTVDACYPARRISAKRAGFRTPPYVDFGNLRTLGILEGDVPADARLERLPLTWNDLAWIRDRTTVPLLIKGILHPDDARRCISIGADGVIVSNHGGRQLDCVVPSVVALEEVADEVRGDCVVIVDGGIRSGLDVVKALALGAQAVCIGRPYLWGLSLDGEKGVEGVLKILHCEIEDALRQLGLDAVSQIGPECLAKIRWLAATEPRPKLEERNYAHEGY